MVAKFLRDALADHPLALNALAAVRHADFRRFVNEDFWLWLLAKGHGRDVEFLQIGAHDGVANDHLRPFVRRWRWRGVMLEPVPSIFARLFANYRDQPGLRLINAALAETDGERSFWRIRDGVTGLPPWADQLGSFDRSVIVGHGDRIPGIELLVVEERVRTISFTTLVREANIQRIDLLAIDTEGYDAKLLATFDFVRFRPKLIIFERKHLSCEDDNLADTVLRRAGYKRTNLVDNAIARPRRA